LLLAMLLVAPVLCPSSCEAQTQTYEVLRAGLSSFRDSATTGVKILDLDALVLAPDERRWSESQPPASLLSLGNQIGATLGQSNRVRVCDASGARACRLVGASQAAMRWGCANA